MLISSLTNQFSNCLDGIFQSLVATIYDWFCGWTNVFIW